MLTSIASKPFEGFEYLVEKTTQIEDKIKDFAKTTFSSIKKINLTHIKYIPSKIFNFIKKNKSTAALAISSLAISIIVFTTISSTAGVLFLGTISFLEAYVCTKYHVKSIDYQFKKLAKEFVKSIETISKNSKNGKQLKNDLETGYATSKFYHLQKDLINFIDKNVKNHDQKVNWKMFLKNLNKSLFINGLTFPSFRYFKTIYDQAFEYSGTITLESYINSLFHHIDSKQKAKFKNTLKELTQGYDLECPTLRTDILKISKTIKSFLENSSKNTIALEVYYELTPPVNLAQS